MALRALKNLISRPDRSRAEETLYSRIRASNSFGKRSGPLHSSASSLIVQDVEQANSPPPSTPISSECALVDEKELQRDDGPIGTQQIFSPRLLSDFTLGLSDGLTVPFALTAGLSALGDTRVVIFGGLAELVAGAISMGVAGYLGAKSERYVLATASYLNRKSGASSR